MNQGIWNYQGIFSEVLLSLRCVLVCVCVLACVFACMSECVRNDNLLDCGTCGSVEKRVWKCLAAVRMCVVLIYRMTECNLCIRGCCGIETKVSGWLKTFLSKFVWDVQDVCGFLEEVFCGCMKMHTWILITAVWRRWIRCICGKE